LVVISDGPCGGGEGELEMGVLFATLVDLRLNLCGKLNNDFVTIDHANPQCSACRTVLALTPFS